MVRITPWYFAGAAVVCAVVGCAHFVEMQAIDHFTTALQTDDLGKLKASASQTFDDKALRRDKDSLAALKNLPLHPDEKVTIVKVEDDGNDKKKVVVTTEKTHKKMQYNLVRDAKSQKWVVDDVILKQKNKDVTANKTVTEQMDLLLAVQDFLVAWHGGKPAQVQAVVAPTFFSLLKDLPQAQLDRITKKVAGEKLRPKEFRPEATIDGNDAIVRLQRAKGTLVLNMAHLKQGWRVSDVSIESRKDKDQMTSARRTARAIHTVVQFLKAYKDDDKRALEKVAASRLFDKCLKVADLKTVPLPAAESLGEKDVVKTHLTKTDNVEVCGGEYVITQGKSTIKISLISPPGVVIDPEKVVFSVDDVTFYDAKEERRLSAVYTSQAKMQLFMNALIKGNLPLVRENSTKDLNFKVWNRLGPVTLTEILPAEIELAVPVITSIDYHGAVTNINVHQGNRELTYVMRDYSGDVTVDDILMPVMDRPSSMKETMQAMLPLRLFAAALRETEGNPHPGDKQLDLLRGVTSNDFNRVVWSQINQVPESAYAVLPRLEMGLASIADATNGQTVVLGDQRYGAKIELVRERDALLIDHVYMLGGGQTETAELKHTLKSTLVRRGSPKAFATDPMSANPIATDPPKTDSPTLNADAFESTATAGAVIPANAESAADFEPPKKFPNVSEKPLAVPGGAGK
jgi:hypothetical protein